MTEPTKIIFNGSCPICAREIAFYRARVDRKGGGAEFVDLNRADLGAYGLTADQAARSLHVVENGRMLDGVDAFRALWRATPGFRWAAWLTGLPGLRQVAGWVYTRLLAPRLYAAHLRRIGQCGAERLNMRDKAR